MSSTETRWVLTFDASCGTCRAVAQVIESERRGKGLELLSLADRDVERWRSQALGTNPPWAPTLLEVGPSRVRGWTGMRMGIRLIGRLGLRGTTRVLRALGSMTSADRGSTEASSGVPRKGFLRLAAGTLVAGGLVLAGRTPAFADSGTAELRSWLKQNKGNLPTRYDDVVSYSMPYRRAIFTESTPRVKSALWVAHVERFRASRPDLTDQQVEVIERAIAVMGDVSLFEQRIRAGDDADKVVSELKTVAIEAFGRDEAYALIAQLGTPAKPEAAVLAGDCGCSPNSDWCGGYCQACCHFTSECPCGGVPCCCEYSGTGCGSGWIYSCNGVCYD